MLTNLNINNTFDTTNAMFGLYMWLMFGFLSHLVNCDLQRMIQNSAVVRHVICLVAFFFLFTIIDGANTDASIASIIIKTLLVYVLFIFTTKSKWYFALPVLALLALDQVLKKVYEQRKQKQADKDKAAAIEAQHRKINYVINIAVILTSIVGMLDYMHLQKIEYGSKFDLFKFFFQVNTNCKPYHPDYSAMRAK